MKKIVLLLASLFIISSIVFFGFKVSDRAINKEKVKGEETEIIIPSPEPSPLPSASASASPISQSKQTIKQKLNSSPSPIPTSSVIPLPSFSPQTGLTAEQVKKLTEELNRAYQERLNEYNGKYSNDTSYSPSPSTHYYDNIDYSSPISNKPSASYCSSKRASIDASYQSKLTSENIRYQNELRSTQQNYADSGLYFSGKQARDTNLIEMQHNENVAQIETQYNQQLAVLKQEGC